MTTLTRTQKQSFVEWLQQNNASDIGCTVCSCDRMTILDDILLMQDYPFVGVMCTGCRHTMLFNAVDTGVIEET